MSNIDNLVQDFLAQKIIAVVGVSDKHETGANLNYKTFKKKGYRVYAVNPRISAFYGSPCYPDLKSIPEKVDAVFMLTSPKLTEQVVQQCGFEYQACLDALPDGHETWSVCGLDQCFTICGGNVQETWDCRDTRFMPGAVFECRFWSQLDAQAVEHVWLFECEWRKTMKLEIISKYPVKNQHLTPLLFVHGTLHTAACWDVHFLDYFAQHGFASHAVNLRGHGKSDGREKLRWTRIADFVDDVANAVRQLPSPPILIGHSMGGFIIQKYLEDHDAPAAVLLSSPSPAGLLPTAIRTARRQPWVFAKVNLRLSLLPLIATPQLVGEAFFSDDLPEEQLLEYWNQTQDDSFMAFLDMVALDLPKPAKVKTPLLVLGVGRDNMIAPREIEATARAYNTQAEIIPDVAHNSMLDPRWQKVAERIRTWLNEVDTSAEIGATYKNSTPLEIESPMLSS